MKETNTLPFHLAIPVYDLEKSRDFYKNVLELLKDNNLVNKRTLDFWKNA